VRKKAARSALWEGGNPGWTSRWGSQGRALFVLGRGEALTAGTTRKEENKVDLRRRGQKDEQATGRYFAKVKKPRKILLKWEREEERGGEKVGQTFPAKVG